MNRGGAIAAVAAGIALAAAWLTPARAERLVLLELFTSEGCSSCPPAEALLAELARTRPDVLPLAFHVTYWDRLGWPDPFAFVAATQRQRAYAGTLGLDGVYTPQVVVDGARDVVGSDRAAVWQALGDAQHAATPPVSLRLARSGDGVSITVGAGEAGAGAALMLAGYDREHRSTVLRGENAGQVLNEANIVRGLVWAGEWRGTALALRAAAPAGEHVAAILQAPDGHILAAASID